MECTQHYNIGPKSGQPTPRLNYYHISVKNEIVVVQYQVFKRPKMYSLGSSANNHCHAAEQYRLSPVGIKYYLNAAKDTNSVSYCTRHIVLGIIDELSIWLLPWSKVGFLIGVSIELTSPPLSARDAGDHAGQSGSVDLAPRIGRWLASERWVYWILLLYQLRHD